MRRLAFNVAFILLQAMALLLADVECNGFCNPESSSGKAPPTQSNTFQAKIEMKDLIANRTTEIEIWNSQPQNLSRINFLQNGNRFDAFYSFSTQEIFVVQAPSQQCSVVSMAKGGDLDHLVGQNINGVFVQKDTMSILRIINQFGIKYIGDNYTVRGLPAAKWSSCQSWPERQSEFEIVWHFAELGWDSVSQSQVPLRIEVTGISNRTDLPNANLHEVYDFVFFRPYLEDSQFIFQTPRGTYCDRRVKTKKLPDLHPVMDFTWEIVKGRLEVVSELLYGKVTYDTKLYILRYDYREPMSSMKPPFYNNGSLSLIQDYESGVSYFIDNLLGNCSAMPIGTEMIGLDNLDQTGQPSWQVVVLRNPRDILQFDDNYQYEGKAMIRGLPVDIFISLRQIELDGNPINVTFEYYILDESVTEIAIGGQGKLGVGQTVPVELRIVSYSELGPDVDPTFVYFERFSFFNFDSPELNSNPNANLDITQPYKYDVGACYKIDEQMNFMIKFKPQADSIKMREITNETELVIRSVVSELSKADLGLVNKIRFQNPKVDYDDQFLYFIATLLDKPDVYYQFAKINQPDATVLSIDSSNFVVSEKECLSLCYSSNGCKSLAFCSGSGLPGGNRNCLLSDKIGFTTNHEAGYSCSVFVSPLNSSSSIAELNLQEAWQQISMAVENNQLVVPVGLPDEQKQNLVAISAENFTIRADVYNPLTGPYLKRFDSFPKKSFNFQNSKLPNRQVLNKITADECARSCVDEISFTCNSAVYCYDLGLCHLTQEAANSDQSNLIDRARCNVYARSSLTQFTEYPGLSQIFIKDKAPIGSVESATKCAEFCLNSAGNDTCRGFDVCQVTGQQLCYLDAGHITDSNAVGQNRTECSHFSKSFESDFSRDRTITNPQSKTMNVINQITEQMCARICVEQIGQQCQGYYYCASSSKCFIRLFSDLEPQQGAGQAEVGQCDYMKRNYNPDGSLYHYTKPQIIDNVSKGVAVGAAVAIYLSLLILGIICSSVAVVGVLHWRGNSVWRDFKAFFTQR